MKRLILIFLCFFGLTLYAVEHAPVNSSPDANSMMMPSVNNNAFMSSGSTYSSAVYEIGSYSPTKSPVRKAPPSTGGESDYDPNNPQFAPIADALILLIILAFSYALYIMRRRI